MYNGSEYNFLLSNKGKHDVMRSYWPLTTTLWFIDDVTHVTCLLPSDY